MSGKFADDAQQTYINTFTKNAQAAGNSTLDAALKETFAVILHQTATKRRNKQVGSFL